MQYTLDEVRDAFTLIDTNRDNVISATEYLQTMKRSGIRGENKHIADMFFSPKMSQPGFINFNEFSYYMLSDECNRSYECNRTYELKKAFDFYDENGDGYITKLELTNVLTRLGNDIVDKEVETIIQSVDLDGDGKISYDEFCKMLGKN